MIQKILLHAERLLIYGWGIILPWQTIWIYRVATLNGFSWQYATLGWYVSEAVLWLLFLVSLWNVRSTISRTRSAQYIKRVGLVLLFFAFPLYAFLSILWSPDFDVSLRHALYIIEGYMFLVTMAMSRTSLKTWLSAFLVGSIGPIALGFYHWFFQSTFASTLLGLSEHTASTLGSSIIASDSIGRWLRAYGPFPHPNIFGGYLVFVLACSFLYSFFTDKKNERVYVYIINACATFALCVTFSRSALIAYVIMCIGFGIHALRFRIKKLGLVLVCSVAVVLLCGIVYADLWQTRTVPTSISETRSLSEREEGIARAWKLHLEKRVIGFGGGVFTHAWYLMDSSLPGYIYQPVHVALLVVLVEYGFMGTFFLILSFALGVSLGVARGGTYRLLFVVSGLVPLVIISFFDHYIVTLYPGIIIFFAYFSLFFRFSTARTELSPSSPQSLHKI